MKPKTYVVIRSGDEYDGLNARVNKTTPGGQVEVYLVGSREDPDGLKGEPLVFCRDELEEL